MGDLQKAINLALDGDTLVLAPGHYTAEPHLYEEYFCGNCDSAITAVRAMRGFVIDARALVIRSPRLGEAVLETRAGYGVLILNSRGTTLENLVITGGRRNPDGKATDGAVVAKNSRVTLRNCRLANNTEYFDSTVVGIGGVMVREGSEVHVEQCAIINNSWDGVALYRGATATITDCVIDSGRGAGIGVTWDAAAICLRNRISRYWKGIGTFGTATAVVRNNAVFNNAGWGIIAAGQSTLIAENNVVARNGNCGFAVWNKGTRGRIVNNISAFNGRRKEWVCPCVGFWNQEADTAGWTVAYNLAWENSAGNVRGMDSSGVFALDPLFADSVNFDVKEASPARGNGDPAIVNRDGARADMGLWGGPSASVRRWTR